jgi:hypothetical protein
MEWISTYSQLLLLHEACMTEWKANENAEKKFVSYIAFFKELGKNVLRKFASRSS